MKNFKKLPRKQLEKFSNIFMQLGLVLVLFVVYVTLEHQTEDKTVVGCTFSYEPNKVYIEPNKEVFFTKEVKIIPKVEMPKPQIFIPEEVVKGNNDIIDTVINLPTEDPKMIDIDALVEIVEKPTFNPEDAVPYISIQNAPVFKGCEGLSKENNKICFDEKMKKFVQRNFNAGIANELGLHSGKHKIQTQFIIDSKGNVVNIKIRAPHKQLEKETSRLLKKLPKFEPGKQNNKAVKVRYTLPITFRVE